MVFHCRCFSFQGYEYETRPVSTSTQTFYTASSTFHPDSQAKAPVSSNLTPKTTNLRVFTLIELKVATNKFCRASKIGRGGVGIVYRGLIKSLVHPFHDIQVAVQCANGELQGHEEWVPEVNVLGAVEHPNLVKLVGYYYNDNERRIQRFLVYEYMPNRNVRDHLSTSSKTPFLWTMRLKVAQDVARGLAYLHEEMDFQIIFEGFKSSSILLDDEWNAKLSYFELARLHHRGESIHGPTLRNKGYKAPECYQRARPHTYKSDIWSYGVFLYELITGRCPLDRNRPENEQKLLEWVKPYLDSKNLQPIIDSRLEGTCSLKSAHELSIIADRCLCIDPKSRPNMSEVLKMVNQLTGVPFQASNPEPGRPKTSDQVLETVNPVPPQAAKSLVRVVIIKLKKVLTCTAKE